ncbi:MAG: hypothetical protein II404_05590 [Prevotella sp.]|nr:hypothetical protein [Prevotella sp.]
MKQLTIYFILLSIALSALGQSHRIEQPDIIFQQQRLFELVAVERSDTATVLDMRVNQKSNLWFMFGDDILLRDIQGCTYPIRGLDSRYGKGLNEKIFARHEGEIRVRLLFPPIPEDVDNVDLTGEPPSKTGIYGIRLDSLKWKDILHADSTGYTIDEWPDDSLPTPTIRYGTATIRGHLKHFRKGMLQHMILYQNASWYQHRVTELDTLWTPITDQGDFEFRLPVTHEQPVALGYEGRRLMMCYAIPDDTTKVALDMFVMHQPKKERQSHFSLVEGHRPLDVLANEYNYTQSLDNYRQLRQSLLYHYFYHPDFIGSNPKKLLPEVVERRVRMRHIYNKNLSPALLELLKLNDQLCMIAIYQQELAAFPNHINQRGGVVKAMYNRRRKRWAEEVKPYVTEAYLQMLSSQKQLLCPSFMGVAHLLSRMPTMYPDYVDHEVNALSMKQQLHKDFTQLDTVQLQQNTSTLPKAYQLWIENYRLQLSRLMADNNQRTDYEICQLPEVPPYSDHLLFERICKRYRGRLIFLHIWYPTINKDMAMTRNIIMPLQKEFEDYDIAWVHLARHNNENSWRQQLPQLPGYHYPFTTNYQPTGIIRSVMGMHQSRYLYVIIDETGSVVYKHNKPTDLLDLREQLKKYAKKKL